MIDRSKWPAEISNFIKNQHAKAKPISVISASPGKNGMIQFVCVQIIETGPQSTGTFLVSHEQARELIERLELLLNLES